MKTKERKKLIKKAKNYIKLVQYLERYNKSHYKDMKRYSELINRLAFCSDRIEINNAMIARINNRVNDLLKQAIQ